MRWVSWWAVMSAVGGSLSVAASGCGRIRGNDSETGVCSVPADGGSPQDRCACGDDPECNGDGDGDGDGECVPEGDEYCLHNGLPCCGDLYCVQHPDGYPNHTICSDTPGDGTAEDAVCGNGVVEPGEDCDDGNELGCDACVECEAYPAVWSIHLERTVWEAVADAEHVYLLGQIDDTPWVTALSPEGQLLWEQPFEAEVVHSRELVALGDRVAVLVRDGSTQMFVIGEGGLVWSEVIPVSWSAARFGEDLAVVDAVAAFPNVQVFDADDGTFVDAFPVGEAHVASSAHPIAITDWNDGLVVGYTDVDDQPVVGWIDAGGAELDTLAVEGHLGGITANPDGQVVVAIRSEDSAFDFTYLTPSGAGETTPSVAPVNFGVYLDALDSLSTGRYAALIETQPDFGLFSMHLEADGRAILDSRHFGYTDDPVAHPCRQSGGAIGVDAAYLPGDDPEGGARLTKFRLID